MQDKTGIKAEMILMWGQWTDYMDLVVKTLSSWYGSQTGAIFPKEHILNRLLANYSHQSNLRVLTTNTSHLHTHYISQR